MTRKLLTLVSFVLIAHSSWPAAARLPPRQPQPLLPRPR